MELFLFIVFVLALYFIPAVVAINRNKKNKVAIITLNCLLGWTTVGWIIALVWALCND